MVKEMLIISFAENRLQRTEIFDYELLLIWLGEQKTLRGFNRRQFKKLICKTLLLIVQYKKQNEITMKM